MYDYWEDGENEKCEYMCTGNRMSKKELNSDISKWEERYFSKTETLISNNINILFRDI